jgi:hypothetical protein
LNLARRLELRFYTAALSVEHAIFRVSGLAASKESPNSIALTIGGQHTLDARAERQPVLPVSFS